ncbi:hypothetical protein C819_01324 [Lachnospiraceae bacterium 10-1]|jgi:hypothetical protein|nr:hypothetical protein C819_01324 [Lachnospiraceae bacterium 10-1]
MLKQNQIVYLKYIFIIFYMYNFSIDLIFEMKYYKIIE